MATGQLGYIASAVPVREVWASNTTLFHLASLYLGDPVLWDKIARMNGLDDPWVGGLVKLAIPNPPQVSNGGLLGL